MKKITVRKVEPQVQIQISDHFGFPLSKEEAKALYDELGKALQEMEVENEH